MTKRDDSIGPTSPNLKRYRYRNPNANPNPNLNRDRNSNPFATYQYAFPALISHVKHRDD